MNGASQVSQVIGLLTGTANEVGLIEGLAAPYWDGNECQLFPIGDKGVAADPRGIDLPRNDQGRDLLLRAATDELHGPAHSASQVVPQRLEHHQIGGQQDRRECKAERRIRGMCAGAEHAKRCGKATSASQ